MNLMEKTLGSVLLISGLILTTGCEAEVVTPEQRALEIIVVGDGSGSDACAVNYDELGAATHPVGAFAEQGTAHVRILDHADKVVWEADTGGLSEEGTSEDEAQVQEMPPDETTMVRLVRGEYRVECAMGTSVSTTSLRVIPASTSPDE